MVNVGAYTRSTKLISSTYQRYTVNVLSGTPVMVTHSPKVCFWSTHLQGLGPSPVGTGFCVLCHFIGCAPSLPALCYQMVTWGKDATSLDSTDEAAASLIVAPTTLGAPNGFFFLDRERYLSTRCLLVA